MGIKMGMIFGIGGLNGNKNGNDYGNVLGIQSLNGNKNGNAYGNDIGNRRFEWE